MLIVDDLLATGDNAEATAKLAHSFGAEIAGLGFVVELDFLKSRDKLREYNRRKWSALSEDAEKNM